MSVCPSKRLKSEWGNVVYRQYHIRKDERLKCVRIIRKLLNLIESLVPRSQTPECSRTIWASACVWRWVIRRKAARSIVELSEGFIRSSNRIQSSVKTSLFVKEKKFKRIDHYSSLYAVENPRIDEWRSILRPGRAHLARGSAGNFLLAADSNRRRNENSIYPTSDKPLLRFSLNHNIETYHRRVWDSLQRFSLSQNIIHGTVRPVIAKNEKLMTHAR